MLYHCSVTITFLIAVQTFLKTCTYSEPWHCKFINCNPKGEAWCLPVIERYSYHLFMHTASQEKCIVVQLFARVTLVVDLHMRS